MTSLLVRDLGIIAYGDAYDMQKRTVARLQRGEGVQTLYLLQHPHVITLGRNATSSSLIAGPELLRRKGVRVVESDRGGDVTYHGPGQLVGYPIVKLEPGRRDIRRFVTDLEQVLLLTLAEFGIRGRRHRVHRGVWVKDRKIASVGIRIARWVTSHGFALNVNTDLSYFSLIHPCGIASCPMTSISRELGAVVELRTVKERVVQNFLQVYERERVFEPATDEVRVHG